jgi:hypothetical protein
LLLKFYYLSQEAPLKIGEHQIKTQNSLREWRMAVPDTQGVLEAISRLRELLKLARILKQTRTIDPPLSTSEILKKSDLSTEKRQFVVIELAARQLFEELVVGISLPFRRMH